MLRDGLHDNQNKILDCEPQRKFKTNYICIKRYLTNKNINFEIGSELLKSLN